MFAILFEALLIEIQEEIPLFAGWEVGVNGHRKCEQKFVNKLAFPKYVCATGQFNRLPGSHPQVEKSRTLTYRELQLRYTRSKTTYFNINWMF